VGFGLAAGLLAGAEGVAEGEVAGTVAVIVPLPDGAPASAGVSTVSGCTTDAAGTGSEPHPAREATAAAVTTRTAGRLSTCAP
jgi:hypothetical protein